MEHPIRRRKQSIFYQYILSYAAILVLPVVILIGIGSASLGHKQQELGELAEQAFAQSVENIEGRFQEVSNLTQLIANNEHLKTVLNGGGSYYDRYQLYKDLEQHCFASSFIQNIYVLFEADGKVVGNDGIITSKEYFYRIKYDQGEEEYKKWLENQWEWQSFTGSLSAGEVRTSPGQRERMIQYIWPVTGRQKVSAKILIFIDEQQFSALVNQVLEVENFSICTQDTGSTISLTAEKEQAADARELLVLQQTAGSGRVYTCSILRDSLFQEWNLQLVVTILLMAVLCVLCGVLSLYFARRNSTPISNVLDLLHKSEGPSSGGENTGSLDYLQGRVSHIIQDRQMLQQELERRLPLLRASFMERLLNGTLPEGTNLEEQLDHLKISLKGEACCVVIFQIVSCPEEDEEANEMPFSAARLLVEDSVYQNAAGDCYLSSMDNDRVTVILALSGQQAEADAAGALCRRVTQEAERQGIRLRAGAGQPYGALADVFLSHIQAKKNLEWINGTEAYSDFLSRLESGPSCFYYPVELEQRLMRVTLSGNGETVARIFDELEKENYQNRSLTDFMSQHLLEELQGTLVKTAAAIREKEVPSLSFGNFGKLLGSTSAGQREGMEGFREAFLEAASLVRSSNAGKDAEYKRRITAYMAERFTDPATSLGTLADSFGVTEVYMSKLFKEKMGMLFSQYLENLRMDKAEELLRHSQTAIGEIASACGYQSPHAFRRAYKRHYGALPSDVRNEKQS